MKKDLKVPKFKSENKERAFWAKLNLAEYFEPSDFEKMRQSMKAKAKKEMYYKCRKCGDEIYWNTHKRMTRCMCKAIAIDGCEYYVRIIGNEGDYQVIWK